MLFFFFNKKIAQYPPHSLKDSEFNYIVRIADATKSKIERKRKNKKDKQS